MTFEYLENIEINKNDFESVINDLNDLQKEIQIPCRIVSSFPAGSKHSTITTMRQSQLYKTTEKFDVYVNKKAKNIFFVDYHEDNMKTHPLVEKYGGNQMAIVLMSPGYESGMHIDYFPTKRTHICLQTDGKSFFEDTDEKIYYEANSVWKIDTSKKHNAGNEGNINRINLIIDKGKDFTFNQIRGIEFDFEEVYACVDHVCKDLLEYKEKHHKNEIVRIMSAYPYGVNHYTSNKIHINEWAIKENEKYKSYTRITKFDTKMISVYFKNTNNMILWHKPVVDLIEKIKEKSGTFGDASVAIVMAGQKFRLESHVDTKGLVRYHVPLIVNDDSYIETFDPYLKWFVKPGEVWSLDTSIKHTAINESEEHVRIHMIIDFLDTQTKFGFQGTEKSAWFV